MSELSDWKRIIYEPEKARYERDITTLTARVKALETGLGEIEGQAVCVGMDGPDGDIEMLKRIAEMALALLTQGDKR